MFESTLLIRLPESGADPDLRAAASSPFLQRIGPGESTLTAAGGEVRLQGMTARVSLLRVPIVDDALDEAAGACLRWSKAGDMVALHDAQILITTRLDNPTPPPSADMSDEKLGEVRARQRMEARAEARFTHHLAAALSQQCNAIGLYRELTRSLISADDILHDLSIMDREGTWPVESWCGIRLVPEQQEDGSIVIGAVTTGATQLAGYEAGLTPVPEEKLREGLRVLLSLASFAISRPAGVGEGDLADPNKSEPSYTAEYHLGEDGMPDLLQITMH
ncbi:MAG: hypothetical protein AAF565_01180 [Pseudomonadota bacterium]